MHLFIVYVEETNWSVLTWLIGQEECLKKGKVFKAESRQVTAPF